MHLGIVSDHFGVQQTASQLTAYVLPTSTAKLTNCLAHYIVQQKIPCTVFDTNHSHHSRVNFDSWFYDVYGVVEKDKLSSDIENVYPSHILDFVGVEPPNGIDYTRLLLINGITYTEKWLDDLRNRAGRNAVASQYNYDVLKSRGFDVTLLPYGVDINTFYNIGPQNKQQQKQRLGLSDKFVFGAVGQNDTKHGYLQLCRAFARVARKHNDVYLYCHTNPLASNGVNLLRLIKQYNIDNRVIFTRSLEKASASESILRDIYNLFDVFIQPRASATNASVLEALATGTPVICSDVLVPKHLVQGCGDAVQSYDSYITEEGVEVPIISDIDLAEKMEALYLDSERRRQYASAGRANILPYDWANVLPQWLDYIRNPKKTRRTITFKDKPNVAIVCTSIGRICGIGDYSLTLLEHLKPHCRTYPYSELSEETVQEIAKSRAVTFIQFEYALYPADGLLRFIGRIQSHGLPVVMVLHTFGTWYKDYTKAMLSADYFVVHSELLKSRLIEVGISQERIFVVPMGIKTYPIQPVDVRKQLGIPVDAKIVAGFGFLEEHKQFELIAEAVKTLRERQWDVYFLLVSITKKNPLSQQAEQNFYNRVQQLGLDKYFIRVGDKQNKSMPQVLQYLSQSDVIVFPYKETFTYSTSAAIREAFSADRPIVCSDITFFGDVDGVVKVKPKSDDIAVAVERIFSDEEYKQSILEQAIKFRDISTWAHTAKAYMNAVEAIATRR